MTKRMTRHWHPWSKAASALVTVLTLVCAAMTLSGCNGGSNGPSGLVPTAIYEGGFLFAGTSRAGEVVLRRFSNNTIDGTLIVTQWSGTSTISPAPGAPPGSYEFTGTVAGNSFTGQGRFLGSPTFNFTITGQLPAEGTLGQATLTGSTSAGAVAVDFSYHQSTTPAGQNSIFTFTGVQNSNVTTAPLNNTISIGSGPPPTPDAFRIHSSFSAFNAALDSAAARTLTVLLTNSRVYRVGDTIPVLPGIGPTTENPAVAQIFYSEGAPANKVWYGTGGTVKIIAISGQKVTMQLIGAKMQPNPTAGFGDPNQGTGSFILNGTGTIIVAKYPLTGSN